MFIRYHKHRPGVRNLAIITKVSSPRRSDLFANHSRSRAKARRPNPRFGRACAHLTCFHRHGTAAGREGNPDKLRRYAVVGATGRNRDIGRKNPSRKSTIANKYLPTLYSRLTSIHMVERIILAEPRGFCAGVEMAIKALTWMLRIFAVPVYCYHEIVHNAWVVRAFQRAGVIFVNDISPGSDRVSGDALCPWLGAPGGGGSL